MLFQEAVQASQVEQTQGKLAGQKPPEISSDAKAGNGGKYKTQAKQQADHIHGKDVPGHTKALKNAGQGGIQIEEGAQESKCGDKITCQGTVE